MHCFELTLIDRDDSPVFFIEKFLVGHFEKYNSNSGYVNEENVRNTPQAFSHFSFERSRHSIMVVDIQVPSYVYWCASFAVISISLCF